MIHINRARRVNKQRRGAVRAWRDKLQGYPAFVLGNGPSLIDHDLTLLKKYFTIGINRVFLADGFDPSILFWQDIELWKQEHAKITKLKAIKYCRDVADPRKIAYHFRLRGGIFTLPSSPLTLHGSGASGPLAFELAMSLKCNPIIFLGYDCRYVDKKTDFYGINNDHKKHTLTRCRKGVRWINSWHERGTCEIINCSDNKVFPPRVSLEEAIEKVNKKEKGQPQNRAFFKAKLLTE